MDGNEIGVVEYFCPLTVLLLKHIEQDLQLGATIDALIGYSFKNRGGGGSITKPLNNSCHMSTIYLKHCIKYIIMLKTTNVH